MKLPSLTAVLFGLLFFKLFPSPSFQEAPLHSGDLDPAFGTGGRVATNFSLLPRSNDEDHAFALAVQPNGKIVVAGSSQGNSSEMDFALARYDIDGTLDPSFGNNGRVLTDLTDNRHDFAYAVVIQGDGKIVAAGVSNGSAAIVRYNADGTLDSTFGLRGTGQVILNIDGFIRGLAIQPDLRIVAAGTSGGEFLAIRLLENGTLDTSFDSDGQTTVSIDRGDIAQDVSIQANGRIVLIGRSEDNSGHVIAVARLFSDGTLDPSFGVAGKAKLRINSLSTAGEAGTLQTDGKVVVVGSVPAERNAGEDFAVVRLNVDGSIDGGFGVNGWSTVDFFGSDAALAVTLQLDGKIVVAGTTQYNRASDGEAERDFAIARLNNDGSIDTGFGQQGKVKTDFGDKNAFLRAIALQADGHIVAAGMSRLDFAIAQYLGRSPSPAITGASVRGKKLDIIGQNFEEGAKILLNGEVQKTKYQSSTMLRGKKAGRIVRVGDKLQVRNPDGTTSAEFAYAS